MHLLGTIHPYHSYSYRLNFKRFCAVLVNIAKHAIPPFRPIFWGTVLGYPQQICGRIPHLALSEFAIRKAKPGEKPYKLYDALGLFLLVNPSGSKLWRHKYSYMGKERLLSYGAYPAVSLAKARRKRNETRELLAEGTDPAAQKKLDKLAAELASRTTFKLVAEEYIESMSERELHRRRCARRDGTCWTLPSPSITDRSMTLRLPNSCICSRASKRVGDERRPRRCVEYCRECFV